MNYIVKEIGKEFFLIRSPEKEFHRNIYLKRFIANDRQNKVNTIFDPGTPVDYENLFKILKDLIGGVQNIDFIFISHQDPDLTSNLRTILTAAPNAVLLASIDTFRLISMYGIPARNFKAVESFQRDVIKIVRTGHLIQFVPAYYCHFRGAMMLYDFESRVLFTGDFLGGLQTRTSDGIYANEDSWRGISMFHQIYMPTKRAVALTIERIGLLNPLPEVVAPQHGDIIKGDLIYDFLDKLRDLDVGVDLLSLTPKEKDTFLEAMNEFLDTLKKMSPDAFNSIFAKLKKSSEFTTIFNFANDVITDVKLLPQDTVDYIVHALFENGYGENASLFVNTLNKYGFMDKLPKFKEQAKMAEALFEE